MRFAFIVAVSAFAALVSATDAATEDCSFCIVHSECKGCGDRTRCVFFTCVPCDGDC
ncbi:hypothetical protein CY34DRAFT_811154 [Suillus luteus UH-Slu-Lm8-n1]|uniref:Uncharacterized protein n=1 Tax=Suillus luteus UH-Slu-Lm8-n1 TaxID=930992 RepID=A0A0D0A4S1_9AGAM|nr:hypothetical protein CY34DRAFT_811154 [Suillus luteus UH-Slu-Lm8-n1]